MFMLNFVAKKKSQQTLHKWFTFSEMYKISVEIFKFQNSG